MEERNPIRWKIVLLVNLGMLGGCILAVFAVPPTTRFSVFAFSCLAVLIAFNVLFYFKGYRRAAVKPNLDPTTTPPRNWWRILLFAVLWIYLIFRVFHYHVWR